MAMNPSELTDAQLKELKKLLETKLASLTSEVNELENDLTDDDNDEKAAPDEVDRSSFEEEMQRTQLVLDGKKHLQFEVMEALKRMEEGHYGVCEETEEPIGYKRLSASPWTRLSIEAQQELELRKKNRQVNPNADAYASAYDSGDEAGDE